MSSGTVKTSPHGGGSKVRTSLDPPGLVSKLYGIFSNRDVPSISGRQPRAMAIVMHWGLLNNPDPRLRRVLLMHDVGFLLGLALEENTVNPNVKFSFK